MSMFAAVLSAFSNPDAQGQIEGVAARLYETMQRAERIEIKLDLLLSVYRGNRPDLTAIPARVDATRDRPASVAGRVADDGAGRDPPAARSSGNGSDCAGGQSEAPSLLNLVERLP